MRLIVCEAVYDEEHSDGSVITDLVDADVYEGRFHRAQVESSPDSEYTFVHGWVLGYENRKNQTSTVPNGIKGWILGHGNIEDLISVVPNGVKVWFECSEGFYSPARVVYAEWFESGRFSPYLVCRDRDGFIYRKEITADMNLIWEKKDFWNADVMTLHVFDIPRYCIRIASSFEELANADQHESVSAMSN